MPFPTTQMIHHSWSRHHQPVVIGSMNAVCQAEDPARSTPGEYDPVTGDRAAPTPYIVVPNGTPCRVQRVLQADTSTQQGEDVSQRLYQVTVPVDAPLASVGYIFTITGTRDQQTDRNTTGLRLRVLDRLRGSEEFDRVYITVHDSD